ncbi:hypothetical protein [Rhodoblastus sp.]
MGLGPGSFHDLVADVGLCYPFPLAELREMEIPLLKQLWARARARLGA